QRQMHLTLTLNRFANRANELDWYRVGLPVETRTYEIVKPPEPTITDTRVDLLRFEDISALTVGLLPLDQPDPPAAKLWPYEKWDWHRNPANAPPDTRLRPIEYVRTVYRRDDMSGPLALGQIESLALPFESYKLAFTPDLAQQIFVDSGKLTAAALNGVFADKGKYVHIEGDANWWIPSGRMFYSPGSNDTAALELAHARTHFFLPHRYRDPFHTNQLNTETIVTYDDHRLLVVETLDALGNAVHAQNDYRVLAPRLMTDPNGNRSEVAFDALGMVVATAAKGKDGQNLGDLLEDFDPDPPLTALQAFVADPQGQAASLLGKATTRIVYDLDRFKRGGQPPFAATLARETHFADPGGALTKIQVSFSYSDGFGREIQKKIQAERGDAPQRGPNVTLPGGDVQPGALVRDANGKPVQADTMQRWVGNGRTVFNNKGKPVRQYEPFFSSTHLYEEEREMTDTGVSPILFYDPVERVVATLHPNHTWEKVVFDPWRQESWDVNDTVTRNPKTDDDVKGSFTRLPDAEYLPTWHEARKNGQQGPHEQAAAEKAAVHADTPTVAHADSLGRTFLTIAHNKFERKKPDGTIETVEEKYPTRIELDIEGNQREVIDAKDRVVMRYDYDLLGNRIHQASMEAG
ncbi:MAG: SpvB/TcaC N-terminal domain-containing protein, partial [Armatimonadota bacterium]